MERPDSTPSGPRPVPGAGGGRIRTLVEGLPYGLIQLSDSYRYVYINDTAERLIGKRRYDVIGRTIWDVFPDLRGTSVEETYAEAMEGGVPLPIEFYYPPHDRFYEIQARPMDRGIVITFSDVTGFRKRLDEIGQIEAVQRAVLYSAEVGILAMDGDGIFTVFNPAAERMLGYSSYEVIGKHKPILFHDLTEVAARERETGIPYGYDLVSGYKRGSSGETEWTYVRKDGTRFPVALRLSRLPGSVDHEEGFLAIASDLTERRAAQAQLSIARDRAEAADRSKSRFLATMSHEIRTPLNGILGVAEALADTSLDDNQRHLVDIVRGSGATLLNVLNDVLDVSKLDAGGFTIAARETDLAREISEVLDLHAPLVAAKGLLLRRQGIDELPTAMVDVLRLRQILGNLLSNAVKFTPAGVVEVRGSVVRGQLRLDVIDDGPGIPANRRDHVFEAFTQLGRPGLGGTGLGLFISRRVARLMEGDLVVMESYGRGAWFRLSVPVREVTTTKIAMRADLAPLNYRILLAEDNETNVLVACAALESLGCSVAVARDGAEALRKWRSERFDAILMDVHMPVMDGREAARRIRAEERDGRIPILALTASVLLDEANDARSAGMDEVITKPFRRSDLDAALRRHVKKPSTPGAEGSGSERP